ncbi:hypothetical protein ACJX0J_015063, partial [Zea mays]
VAITLHAVKCFSFPRPMYSKSIAAIKNRHILSKHNETRITNSSTIYPFLYNVRKEIPSSLGSPYASIMYIYIVISIYFTLEKKINTTLKLDPQAGTLCKHVVDGAAIELMRQAIADPSIEYIITFILECSNNMTNLLC